jgi:phosphohistidine phosphatase
MNRRIYFIRHAIAADREAFEGDDLARPLTDKGRRKARAIFARLADVRPAPDRVISSAATRARETAEIFCEAFKLSGPSIDEALNPGARPAAFRKLLEALPAKTECVALVGHEPDFSLAISELTSGGALDLRLKKCGIVEIEWSPDNGGILLMALPPDVLSG